MWRKNIKNRCYRCHEVGHFIRECPTTSRHEVNYDYDDHVYIFNDESSSTAMWRKFMKNRCHRCHEVGHFIRECPTTSRHELNYDEEDDDCAWMWNGNDSDDSRSSSTEEPNLSTYPSEPVARFAPTKNSPLPPTLAEFEELGKIEIAHEEAQIEWSITDLVSSTKNNVLYHSPDVSIANVSWSLKIWHVNVGDIYVYVRSNVHREYPVEYSFALKKSSDSVEQFGSGIIKRNQIASDVHGFKCSSSGVIDIRCKISKCKIITHPTEPTASDKTKPLKLISLDRLSEKFQNLFSNKETCDTTLKFKDKEYRVHRAILIAQSPVFAAMFTHDTLERQTGVISIPDCDSHSFQSFLEYLYCGKLEEISFPSALHLYVISDKYEVEELKAFCITYLMQCLTLENFCEIVVFADKYDVAELLSASQEFFNVNVIEIIETSEWESLMKKDYRLANELLKMKFRS